MYNFDEEVIIAQELRQRKEYWDMLHKETNGDYIYTRFCVWCNAYNNGQGKHDARLFARYIKENNIEMNWWQRNRIAENYFDYEITYDSKNEKWIEKKQKKENI